MNFKLKTPNSKNESLILFYANLKNGERFVYSTGERIHPQYWDKSNQYPKKSKVKDEQITYNLISGQLDRYTKLFRSFYAQCAATEEIVTKKALKDCFNQEFKRVKRNNDFETVFDEYVEYKFKLGDWTKGTKKLNQRILKLIKEFEDIHGKVQFSSVTMKWYANFKHYCETIKKHNVNTFGRNIGLIKAFLNYALENQYTNNDTFNKFKIKLEVTHQEVLTHEEIIQLYKFVFQNSKLERVRDVFVFACLTGMRYSDFKRVSKSNIQNDSILLRETKDKSKHLTIPLTSISKSILKKYDYKFPTISDQKFRDYLKEACKAVGFAQIVTSTKRIGNEVIELKQPRYERISTHTARRSFITVMLNKGIPYKVIMNITGHKSIKTFNSYYRPTVTDSQKFMKQVWGDESVLKIA
jgi:integrase